MQVQQFDTESGGWLADHNDRAVLIQRLNHPQHCASGRQWHDVQKRQAAAEYPLPGQQIGERRRLIGGTRQQQAPTGHS
ncbi:hypothetical protein D9M71_757640 [compost metagenome]